MPRKTQPGRLDMIVSLRLRAEDREALEALSARLHDLPPATVARIAMRVGIEELTANPARIASQTIERRGGARRRK